MQETDIPRLWSQYASTKDPEVKNELILFYLPLVKSAAIRLASGLPSHIQLQDLMSAGVLGLIASIDKFDIRLGIQFKTFAGMRIHGAMIDELRNLDWVPRSVRTRAKKLQTAYTLLQQEKGRFATDAEVADFLGLSMEQFNEYVDSTQIVTMVSLDAKIYNSKSDSQINYSEIIQDKSPASDPLTGLHQEELKDLLVKSINEMSQQEKLVLTLYYFEELTLKEIGAVLGVTESRVSQIHSKAIYRLKARLHFSEVDSHASA